MVYRRVIGVMTVRRNIGGSAWRLIISRSGCPTSVEPPYAGLRAPGQPGGTAGMKRGNIFVIIADGRLVVADVVFMNPSAAAYVSAASHNAGAAAAVAERGKYGALPALGEGTGCDFVPLATESYGPRVDGAGVPGRCRHDGRVPQWAHVPCVHALACVRGRAAVGASP
jgi:hypothetical protein